MDFYYIRQILRGIKHKRFNSLIKVLGITLVFIQLKTGLITLDPSSYYIKTVPVNLDPVHIILLNAGTMAAIIVMLLVPSQLISRITPVKAIRYD